MVAWNELSGSPTFDVTAGSASAQRQGLIAWDDVDALVDEVFPPTQTAGQATIIAAGAPFPGRDALRAETIQIRPFGDRIVGPSTSQDFNTTAEYDTAAVIIKYATPTFSVDEADPVEFLTHRWAIGGEFQTIGPGNLQWADDSTDPGEDVNAGIFIPTIEHQVTWPRVLDPPFSVMRDRTGKVNSDAMSLSTGTIAAETLLFLGAELERQVLSDGSRAWEVTYRFSERRVVPQDGGSVGGWNHFYRSDSDKGGFYRIKNTGPGPSFNVYESASFNELFQPEAS